MNNTPRISFIFPFRWLKQDSKYLKKNITEMVNKNLNRVPMHPMLGSQLNNYFVRLKQHSNQPKPYKMNKVAMEEILQDSLFGARCIGFEKYFVQTTSKTALPIMELEIFG